MAFFDLIEKLINEHGSATVLRERLELIKAEYDALERKCEDLRRENVTLKTQLSNLQAQQSCEHHCDHCGSANLIRAGNRPNPTFGDLGVKDAIFRCNDCGRESQFIQEK